MERDEGGPDDLPSPLPAVWPYLILCAVVALWVDLGTLHRDQHADSILNVLISLQRWTPFVWEQDRFGMLVPLLTLPIRHPLANLLAQAFLSTLAGLFAFYFLARYAIRTAEYPLIGTLGAASLLALTPPYYRFEYLVDTSYGISFSLALWALIVVEPGFRSGSWKGWVGPLVLMVLAHWVNSATALFLGPFVLLRGLFGSGPPSRWPVAILRYPAIPIRDRIEILARALWRVETFRALVLLAAGYASGKLMIALSPYQPTDYAAMRTDEWHLAWWALLRNNLTALEPPIWLGLLALEALIGLIGLALRPRRWSSGVARSAWALLIAAVALWLLMGTREWIKVNQFAFRYLFPSAMLAQTAIGALAVEALSRAWRTRPRFRPSFAAFAATAILLAAGTWNYGFPSLAGVRAEIDRKCGGFTDDLLASKATCFAGDYWLVWPAVFHANLVLYERGDPRTIWGLTFRCQPTFELWRDTPRETWLAAVPRDRGQEVTYLRSYLLGKIEEVGVRGTIRLFREVSR